MYPMNCNYGTVTDTAPPNVKILIHYLMTGT